MKNPEILIACGHFLRLLWQVNAKENCGALVSDSLLNTCLRTMLLSLGIIVSTKTENTVNEKNVTQIRYWVNLKT